MKENSKVASWRANSGQQGRQNQNRGQEQGSGSPRRMSFTESQVKFSNPQRKVTTSRAGNGTNKRASNYKFPGTLEKNHRSGL